MAVAASQQFLQRLNFFLLLHFVGLFCLLIFASNLGLSNDRLEYPGPLSPSHFDSWWATLQKYRLLHRQLLNDSIYHVPQLLWTQTSFIQTLVPSYDRFFYDPVQRRYTVDRLLNDLLLRYGGIDSVLIWPSYVNLGIDDRNQFDLLLAMPGHLAALKNVVGQFHSRGVQVLLPYNPWDQGTRPNEKSDPDSLAELLVGANADGFNGDTMDIIPKSFYDTCVAHGKPCAMEPEHGGEESSLNWTTVGWGYWGDTQHNYPYIPSVSRLKLVAPAFMTHLCYRAAKNRTNYLQFAWFNGIGYESWEDVFGSWNGLTAFDGETIRRVAHMLRFFGKRGFFSSPDWVPHTPVINGKQVFSSKWTVSEGETLFSLINRASTDSNGPQIRVGTVQGMYFYDCYHGAELKTDSSRLLSFGIEGYGFGCILVSNRSLSSSLREFLSEMANMTSKPLSYYDKTWKCLQQQKVFVEPTKSFASAPAGMVLIPGSTSYHFEVNADVRPGDVQYPWEDCSQKTHSKVLDVKSFYIGKFPVTNAQYEDYLVASKYFPEDEFNFLKDWINGTYPQGWGKKPVTWVSLDEARSFCSFYGLRLPGEIEWQYAASGGIRNRLYPWGNTKDISKYPVQHTGRTRYPPDDVDSRSPVSDSPFGVSDLVGNVWQYTDEYQDLHTLAVVLRGSSNYYPSGSRWYFPQALELNAHARYLLMGDSYDRAGTISFRCAADT